MSDEEYESSSPEEDFSASEDEWKPGKSSSNRRQAASDESDDDDSDFEDNSPSSKRREAKSSSSTSKGDTLSKQTKKRKSTGTSLRTKLFNKYKPPPKTVGRSNQSNQGEPQKQNKTAQTEKKAPRAVTNSKRAVLSDSESSGDDYLVNPDEIDLKSSFFDVKPSTSTSTVNAAPKFDCDAGMKLSDSEENEDDDDDDDETESSKDITITNSIKSTTAKPVDLGYLQDFAKNMEKAKVQYKKHKERSLLEDPNAKVDVSSLLAMGEGTSMTTNASASASTSTKKTKNPKRQTKKTQPSQQLADTDSDLEEVEGGDDYEQQLPDSLANGIQVCVDLPQRQRKDKKAVDAEACLKRQLNRIIKENQMFMHKVALLGHIYHGLFLNKIANNIYLMPIALKILPSNNVYPSGQTEIKYFQSMITWFKSAVKIRDNRKYPQLKVDPLISLGVQMKHRHAVCKRDFILIFVILLRAMGMQCRLVFNMTPPPLKPPQSSLCSLKNNQSSSSTEQKSKTKKTIVKDEKKVPKKEPIKSPSMSMEAREELRKKVEILENEIIKKKQEKLQPKPSFEEVIEAKVDVKATRPTRNAAIIKSKEIKVDDLKRKSQYTSNEPEKKRKGKEPSTKSKHFSKSSDSNDKQKDLVSSIESFSKSFDEQKPSILITSEPTRKQVAKQPPTASTSRSSRSRKDAEAKPTAIPDIVVFADEEQNLENITNKRNATTRGTRAVKSRSKSPKAFVSTKFMQTKASKALHADAAEIEAKRRRSKSHSPSNSVAKSYISTEFLKTKSNRKAVAVEVGKPSPRKTRAKAKLTIPQLDGADDIPKKVRNRRKPIKIPTNTDDEFETPPPNKKPRGVERVKQIDRQVLSPQISGDDEENESPSKSKNALNMWVEVYCELEAQWICVDLFKGKVNCLDNIRKSVASSNLAYVFAFNNDATLKDVTPRYCTQWAAVLRKSRVDQAWLDEAIQKYVSTGRTQRDLTEDMDLRRIHLDKPMPTTISEYKDHPLYALERHLLKFQVIYPPNALTLGFVRGEPVYARECVHTCHSREIWLKEARVVKLGEQPCKVVKARPKWDRLNNTVIKDQPLEIFGYWQTKDYEPPTAENGIVPRNAYGNVELFKECMLPKKTVHLHLPGLNRVCKKLGIDCASAVIGFDFHQGSCHPLYDGFVVCEEFADKVVDAWNKDQEEAERKEQDKYESRVFGNWKKLIKGLIIRERLKVKYNF